MDERRLRSVLSDLPLGGLRFFRSIGSTNDEALTWAAAGAPDRAFVLAEEQTSGRGRGDRSWYSPPGAGLAFSLILHPLRGEEVFPPLFSAVGALSVCETLGALGLHPEIKWPNDVLLHRRKVCGVLAEAVWSGNKLDYIVIGIGVNVRPEAVPQTERLNFPATSIEVEAGRAIDRLHLLREILIALLYWRGLITNSIFFQTWENYLAFRGEQVECLVETGERQVGCIEGLEKDGSLRLRSPSGEVFSVHFGEVHLRPVV